MKTNDLIPALRTHCRRPVAIVGVGNPMRGDDAFGPAVVAQLPPLEGVATFEAGMAPENWLGPIARAKPRSIIVLDTADIGLPPGTICLLDPTELDAVATTTHGMPLGLFIEILEERCSAPAIVLAVQPATLALGEGMTPEVRAAVEKAVGAITAATEPTPN